MPPATQKILSMNRQKRPAGGATFECLDRRQKGIGSINLKPYKDRRYTFCFCFLLLISSFFIHFSLFCLFFDFSVFPWKFLKFKGWP